MEHCSGISVAQGWCRRRAFPHSGFGNVNIWCGTGMKCLGASSSPVSLAVWGEWLPLYSSLASWSWLLDVPSS